MSTIGPRTPRRPNRSSSSPSTCSRSEARELNPQQTIEIIVTKKRDVGCSHKSDRSASSLIGLYQDKSRRLSHAARTLLDSFPKDPDFGDECQSEQDRSKVGKPDPIHDGVGQPQIEEARGPEGSRGIRLPGQLRNDNECRERSKYLDRVQVGSMRPLSPGGHGPWQSGVDVVLRLKWSVGHHLANDIGNPQYGGQHRRINEISEVGCHLEPPGWDARIAVRPDWPPQTFHPEPKRQHLNIYFARRKQKPVAGSR